MIIQNARLLDNEEILKEYENLRIQEGCLYYDIKSKNMVGYSMVEQKKDIDELHALRCEISRVRDLLLKRGYRIA
jgi:hypothetical protein